jgi:hypothetical protein
MSRNVLSCVVIGVPVVILLVLLLLMLRALRLALYLLLLLALLSAGYKHVHNIMLTTTDCLLQTRTQSHAKQVFKRRVKRSKKKLLLQNGMSPGDDQQDPDVNSDQEESEVISSRRNL